jgi:hypothetical protein
MKKKIIMLAACAATLALVQTGHAQTAGKIQAQARKPGQVMCVTTPCNQPGQPTKPKTGKKTPDSKRTVPQLPKAKKGNRPG